MLQIQNITKQYTVGDTVQTALDSVSLNFRDNEFVAILGTSGAGKTTLLNIIGGLDRYDSGDLIINGVSTKKYKDRDWDSYRNHTIGFVFQSYNLIPHQTILSNVELALTISGISKKERIERAKEALIKVGLEQHMNKKPNQLSGGQMQRVAIARALVNNPSILLADEPTGALDSETSVQVMDMLKEVAKDRLVVMVTHNPELAEQYATRIVRVKDGRVIDDSDPFDAKVDDNLSTKNMGKSSMSFLTSLALSFNNLKTKKARTFLTAFAGSIGIIGIAMILSFSNGVNQYIADIQKDTMTAYPIVIEKQTFDLTKLLSNSEAEEDDEENAVTHDKTGVYYNNRSLNMTSSVLTNIVENNLTDFKAYLEDENSEIRSYIGANGIVYTYDVKFDLMSYDSNHTLLHADGRDLKVSQLEESTNNNTSAFSSTVATHNNVYGEILSNDDGTVSDAIVDQYEVVEGRFPSAYNEMVLVLNKNNEVDSKVLYSLGVLPSIEYNKLIDRINAEEELDLETLPIDAKEILDHEFYLIPQCDYYAKNETTGLFEETTEISQDMIDNSIDVKIVGIIKPKEDVDHPLIERRVGYTKALTNYIIEYTDNSEVVKAQRADTTKNVINGYSFEVKSDADKINDVKMYFSVLSNEEKVIMMGGDVTDEANSQMMLQAFDMYMANADDDTLLGIYDNFISAGTYDSNMSKFGVVDTASPAVINIYVDSFENKEKIADCIKAYNKQAGEGGEITYTDYIGLVLSSVTTIIDVISYVLIAFVSVSLVVSSIMIGIITYISVLERTKEIGILRAIGASKRNVSQVFNAETFIIGLLSGMLGIGITLVLLIPSNYIIHSVSNNPNVNAVLPVGNAVLLIILSTVLTLIGGLIPAKKASKQNPVIALRSE